MNFNCNTKSVLVALYILSISSPSSKAFTIQPSSSRASTLTQQPSTQLFSTTSSNKDTEDAFSAFAESLDEDDLFNSDSSRSNGSTVFNSNSDVYAEKTWQESIEELLDPTTPLAKRQILLTDLLNSNENIRDDVLAALRERKVRRTSLYMN